jgi:hypothetical protein
VQPQFANFPNGDAIEHLLKMPDIEGNPITGLVLMSGAP